MTGRCLAGRLCTCQKELKQYGGGMRSDLYAKEGGVLCVLVINADKSEN